MNTMNRRGNRAVRRIPAVLGIVGCLTLGIAGALTPAVTAAASEETQGSGGAEEVRIGGGYAVTGQLGKVGYSAKLFDATNGLPTSDANCILGTGDGYLWI
ncbi:MAG: hypothetical protein IK096_05145, partial [Lachnospiraceae bacterium]|nr:hypothetical protein [Lachnospiraceae bacterium]